ncbi:unnamed protein product [Cercopithifilaria johnstoni]|uniref:G-protein coupled receptors family 1 profile domain-containing protein n=1 Tax=Cercopithifilaria johnstoni TaxID=2874296 RepID=A0A8J2LQB3_9BILA|nr:unnamed protein product [Cercopithifilaria johnstoni]
MSFAVNETATERIKNVNANEKEAIVRAISIILHTYGYIVIGIFLTSINIPVFLLVITRKALRSPYLVLAIVFLNNGLTGICAILTGIKRIIDTANGEKLIDHYKCVLNVHTFLLTLFFLNGWSLLMHSLERLCVVAFPIYYYKKSARISYSLIAAQYIIAIIEITSTVIASLIESPRRISNFCTKFGRQFLTRHSHNRDLSTFLDNQKRYTHTSLISCCFTFFFVVAPSALEYIYVMDSSVLSRIIIMCCAYLWILNSFNMVVLFLYRQGDSQRAAIRCFKYLLCERKHTVQPMVVFGIGK